MWYPFKFRGKLSYAAVGGLLGEELGDASPQTWKRRRRWRLARQNDPDFLVAAVDRSQRSVVEGWTDTPAHRFASVVLRSEIGDGVSVWTETRDRRGGFTWFRLEPGRSSTTLDCRSGRMIGWTTIVDGRTVKVLHPEHVSANDLELELVPLTSVGPGDGSGPTGSAG